MQRDRLRVIGFSALLGLALLFLWQALTSVQPVGRGVPGPLAVGATAVQMLAHPFYNNGPNDKGIGLQFAASLGRLGVGWVVAAEMLIGGTGIGYFVWNEWNNLALTSVIFAILAIGLIGVLLDAVLGRLSRRLAYTE